jgi:hypothetical protein
MNFGENPIGMRILRLTEFTAVRRFFRISKPFLIKFITASKRFFWNRGIVTYAEGRASFGDGPMFDVHPAKADWPRLAGEAFPGSPKPLWLTAEQLSVRLGEGRGRHAMHKHKGTDDQAADHPRLLNARFPQ